MLGAWLQEFYSVQASETEREDALEHSLKKWYGMQDSNLVKHGVQVMWDDYMLIDADTSLYTAMDKAEYLHISGGSCALCHHYYLWDLEPDKSKCSDCDLNGISYVDCNTCHVQAQDHCRECPLFEIHGRSCELEYQAARHERSPRAMIELLEQAAALAALED